MALCIDYDIGRTDSAGDTCAWYADNKEQCGYFDTETFLANFDCCWCNGGQQEYLNSTCVDTHGVGTWNTDSGLDGCAWYANHTDACGDFDTDRFKANE